ncbi:MAG: type II toxin-antitoxin system VapC family toxin [Chloroflexi bacterium]|nr:type II toxin-antitoxin system VapC family toxin [Chloroflexota bacterium]
MSSTVVVDTDILIDAALNIQQAIDYLQAIEQQAALSVSIVTYFELLAGARNKAEIRDIERFLQRFLVLKLDERVSDVALGLLRQYRLSHGLAIPDALIAATAVAMGYPLVSKNQRDYRFVAELSLLPYPG